MPDKGTRWLMLDKELRELQIQVRSWGLLFPYEKDHVRHRLVELTKEAHEIIGDDALTDAVIETIQEVTNSR